MPKEIDKESLFPSKLAEILHSKETSEYIEWNSKSKRIEIMDLKGFEENVLPLYFRHGRFESFVRQMNLYGFKKHRNSKTHIFTHEELDGNIDTILSLKSRYQKRRENSNLEEDDNNEASFHVENKNEQNGSFHLGNDQNYQNFNNFLQYKSEHSIGSLENNEHHYGNLIYFNPLPFYNTLCLNGWNTNCEQTGYFLMPNQSEYYRN